MFIIQKIFNQNKLTFKFHFPGNFGITGPSIRRAASNMLTFRQKLGTLF